MEEANLNSQINFALVTSNSLMNKITSWKSYQSMDQSQYLDLIDYSKELINSDPSHKISFLVIAQGIDEIEEQEQEAKEKAKEEAQKALIKEKEMEEKSNALRINSKNILNSIYGR